eukprot:TRINITY_DN204_c0_g1_i7.p1 TRINITY_DN204_c0_g1~~TRINITY_DN204_c0_g1_i7.p1  ORF type:complete len:310 (+),score=33.01 TRINITY_DN204_c0_g1_i7:188-1117(+)
MCIRDRFYILCCNCSFLSSKLLSRKNSNMKPVIGIYTQPSDFPEYPSEQYQYVDLSPIKYLEQSGVEVINLNYNSNSTTLDLLFSKINGIFFPGGWVNITEDSQFYQNALYLFNKAKTANDNGDFFPVWGTCQGFELMHLFVSDFGNVLQPIEDDMDILHPIKIVTKGKVYNELPSAVEQYVTSGSTVYFTHELAVYPQSYIQYPQLQKFYTITSLAQNDQGKTYVASIEADDYPFYGTQFHAEAFNFLWDCNCDHGDLGVQFSQYMADFFATQAKINNHKFSSDAELLSYLIWNNQYVSQYDVFIIGN